MEKEKEIKFVSLCSSHNNVWTQPACKLTGVMFHWLTHKYTLSGRIALVAFSLTIGSAGFDVRCLRNWSCLHSVNKFLCTEKLVINDFQGLLWPKFCVMTVNVEQLRINDFMDRNSTVFGWTLKTTYGCLCKRQFDSPWRVHENKPYFLK